MPKGLSYIKPILAKQARSAKISKPTGLMYPAGTGLMNKPVNNDGRRLFSDEADSSSSASGKGSKFLVGNTNITLTDGYGVRSFAGREGKHSTGVDYVTDTGNAVSLTDGVIESVKLQGDGSRYRPEAVDADGNQKPGSAGYYVVVRNSDGTKSQYMHLDAMTKDEMESLKGKQLKKGDNIWGYSQGSGSMTGPHVKYRTYTGSSASASHTNPLKQILNN